mmetsp:Transcript_1768/g.3795  ORF Transcript_1768/g.3795 Transcript_1768/m.3795 type:complete len:332 (-) Transcript_1768:190-1185(-)
MKVVLLSTTALAAIATTCAFAPSHQQSKTRSLSPLRISNTAIAALPQAVSDPYKNLPWNTEREEKKKQRRLTHENAALFRELGLPEDATYEDVAAKTEHLIELTEDLPKNEGIKKRIKIEISRDKIYQIRLNERISGVRAEQEDAARVSKLEDEGLDGLASMISDNVDDIVKPKQKLRIPVVSGLVEYFQSIFVPPDEKWRKRQIMVWGLSTLACLINPPLTEGFARVNWLPAGGMMGYRGMKGMEDVGSGYNPFRGKRNKSHQVKAMGIAILGWIVARSLAEMVVSKVPAMAASRSAVWYKFAFTQATLGLLVSYIQTYKEDEEGKELMI